MQVRLKREHYTGRGYHSDGLGLGETVEVQGGHHTRVEGGYFKVYSVDGQELASWPEGKVAGARR